MRESSDRDQDTTTPLPDSAGAGGAEDAPGTRVPQPEPGPRAVDGHSLEARGTDASADTEPAADAIHGYEDLESDPA